MRKMYFLLLLDEVIFRCHLYKLMNGVVKFTCVLTDFCLLDLSVSDRGVLKTLSVMVDSSISPFRAISFCLTYFKCSVVRCIHIKNFMSS